MAPLGYCIDGKRNGFSLRTLYQKGLTFEEAANTHEFAYTNIVEKDEYVYSIFDLNDNQILSMKDYYKTFNDEMIPAEIIHTRPIAIRVARYDHKPFNEVTGIINCCTGEPVKLADKVESYIKEHNLNIELEYGAFPDRPYNLS